MNLIVAVDENFAIGNKLGLLCHLPEDLKRFKELTLNKTVVMGYNTLMSLPRSQPLKNRTNVVLTRKDITVEGATVVHSVEQALALCPPDSFIIGGSSIYKQFLPYCQKAYITHIEKAFEADTFFPPLDQDWEMTQRSQRLEHEGMGFRFCLWERKQK